MNLGQLGEKYFEELINDPNYEVSSAELSTNSVKFAIRSLYWFPPRQSQIQMRLPEIQKGLVSYLQGLFPTYVIQLESSVKHGEDWFFVVSYYPQVHLPKEIIQQIFGHLGGEEVNRLVSADPELRRILDLSNPYFWYLLVMEKYGQIYPQLKNLRRDTISWEKLYNELDSTPLTFDLKMLAQAVLKERIEIVKMLLQDPRFTFPIGKLPESLKRWVRRAQQESSTQDDSARTYRIQGDQVIYDMSVVIPVDLEEFPIRRPIALAYTPERERLYVISEEDL